MSDSGSSEDSPSRNTSSTSQGDDNSLIGSDFGPLFIGDDNSTSTSTTDELDISHYDPTPWDNPYPQPHWFSCRQFISREYGRNVRPGLLNKKPNFTPYSPYWFRKYAYNSLHFIQRMEMSYILEHHIGCVNSLNFNESGDLLASGSDDLLINIWDWQTAKLKHSFSSGHSSNVFQSLWCLNDTHIITCARDGYIRICDINNVSGSSKRICCHLGPVHRLTFPAPQVVLSSGEDGLVYEIDLRTNKPTCLLVLRNQKNRAIPLYSIHCNQVFTPNYFAVGGRSPNVCIFDRRFLRKPSGDDSSSSSDSSSDNELSRLNDAPTPAPVMELCPKSNENSSHCVTCAVYNSTGSKILMSYNDEDMYVFDLKTGKQEGKYQGHRNSTTIKGCSWFGDEYVLSGSDDGYIYGWDRKSQHIVMSLKADRCGAVNCIEVHPHIPVIASSGIADDIKIWEPTADVWPETLTGIKKRICENMRDRTLEPKCYSLNANGPAIWLFLRHMRQRLRDDDSDSPEEDDNSTDGPCLPS